jgi:hypothetical protein
VATPERARRLIGNVWQYVTASENGGGGGGVEEIVADDASITVTNGTGPTVGLSANGGSQPSIQFADFTFEEQATAGEYLATFDIPAGRTILDVLVIPSAAPWAADTAVLKVGDSNGEDTLITQANLVGDILDPYDPITGLDPMTNGTNFNDAHRFNSAGVHGIIGPGANVGGVGTTGFGVSYYTPDTLTVKVTTTIATPPVVPAGAFLARVLYVDADPATAAGFAPA